MVDHASWVPRKERDETGSHTHKNRTPWSLFYFLSFELFNPSEDINMNMLYHLLFKYLVVSTFLYYMLCLKHKKITIIAVLYVCVSLNYKTDVEIILR